MLLQYSVSSCNKKQVPYNAMLAMQALHNTNKYLYSVTEPARVQCGTKREKGNWTNQSPSCHIESPPAEHFPDPWMCQDLVHGDPPLGVWVHHLLEQVP